MYDRKPNCSYNCLIGMALKSSESGRLPVGEIYRFFEREFPYFLSAAEPWKNSLRHSLSLGHYFRKYNSDKLVTKKGHLWEVNPQRAAELDKEMYMFLARGLPENVPSSPQLSKLRLQMTQLLLDSIKNTRTPPSSSTSSTSQNRHHRHRHSSMYSLGPPPPPLQPHMLSTSYGPQAVQAVPQTFKQPGADIVMLAPQAIFGNDPQRTVMTVLSSGEMPNCNGMSCLYSSPLAWQQHSQQVPSQPSLTPKPLAHEAQVPSPLKGFNRHQGLERAGTDSPKEGEMCEEAYQLVQFCNHCSFDGLGDRETPDPAVAYPSHQNEAHTMKNKQPRRRVSSHLLDETLLAAELETAFAMEMGQDAYYPFIKPPTEESDVALAKLNGFHSYWLGPNPPRELTITKCKPKPKHMSRVCLELEKAVQPLVQDWNTIWVTERVLRLMNDECVMSFIEHQTGEDIKRFLARRKISKSLNIVTASKKAVDDNSASGLGCTVSITESPACDTPKRPKRNYSSRKLELKESPSVKRFKNTSAKTVIETPAEEKSISSLIVSIPFRKLITERQMKKYCTREQQGGRRYGGRGKTRSSGKQAASTK